MTQRSMDTPLYSLTALFPTPDALMKAAAATVKAGYTRYDVHAPYPVHGIDRAMQLKTSPLGYFALVFGVLGGVGAVGLMSWITLVDYPLVIGGKPFWSWPAFVPVAFEITVLSAAVLTVVSMIVIFFKFPNNSHPLHDTPYMKRVASDGFGICIEAADPIFDEQRVRTFLGSIGGTDVAVVHYDLEDLRHGAKMFDPKFVGLLVAVAAIVSATTYFTLNILLYAAPYNWMMTQGKLNAQAASTLFKDGIGMRPPVQGTIARGMMPYPYKGKPEDAGKFLVNPLPFNDSTVAMGHAKFLTFCSPCHGNFGRGDSRLAGQFPNPPTLHSDKVRQWPDGSIYHVMTEGQNVMPSYASQLTRDERWAIVHYIRVLQRAHNAKESDLQ
jgi:mono/diheme cytochrome c family protein